jgi:flavin reductase (DIM6/NTAB) family NADH-FMN oxidoreductase RutF
MAVDSREFREAMGAFATGVTIVTAVSPEGEFLGITANSFNSVSLDPPMVLFSLARRAYSLKGFVASDHFAVNVLREDQAELSTTFATALIDKWAGVAYETWTSGCPILPGALAAFECTTRFHYEGGDHIIFVGEVTRLRLENDGRPLLYFRGGYRTLRRDG